MKRLSAMAAIVAVLVSGAAPAQQTSTELDALLERAVGSSRVPMVVAMVARPEGAIYESAVGAPKDAIFQVASMTKPVTAVAVMQLVEKGRVTLDAPASTYVPELASVRVLDAGTLREPKAPLTVRHLLTHTAGFGYEFLNRELFELVNRKELPSMTAGGDGFMRAPLVFDPGARWEYGISTDWLGRLVERVSGETLEAYFREHIFEPLGMLDSSYVLPAAKHSRVVPTFARLEDGGLARQPGAPPAPLDFFPGGSGLYSTAADYLAFVRALVNGGQLRGRRILSAESVAMMGTNQIGSLDVRTMPSLIPGFIRDGAALPGAPDKFGLGVALNSRPIAGGRGANTMSWAGVFNTFFWIDREKQVGAVFLTQLLPFLDEGALSTVGEFERRVYELAGPPSRN
jgi:CubicO group peptidase (beta-lactamase class C family)